MEDETPETALGQHEGGPFAHAEVPGMAGAYPLCGTYGPRDVITTAEHATCPQCRAQVEVQLDLPAMAAYAAFRDLDAPEAAEAFQRTTESVRAQFRAIADAVLMVNGSGAAHPQQTRTLRSDLEAQIRLWRHESDPDQDDDGYDRAGRNATGVCANEIAQILARHGTGQAPDSARDALDAQTLHDSPGADL